MVSFTDSMTNLLTFFILLITFSAFGDCGTGVNEGIGVRSPGATVHNASMPALDGMAPPPASPARETAAGSEKPNPSAEAAFLNRPRPPIGILDTEVYSDRKIIHIPSKLIFYGWGSFVTEAGQIRLAQVAALLRLHPCQVIIGESSHLHPNHPLFNRPNASTERAWSVLEFLTQKEGLATDQISLEAQATALTEASRGEPVVEIVLLTQRVYP